MSRQEPIAVENKLSPDEVILLTEIVRGRTNPQLCVILSLTTSQVQIRIHALYERFGVCNLGRQSRPYALAKAVTDYGLEAPGELALAIAALRENDSILGDIDRIILKLISEGWTVAEIAEDLDENEPDIKIRLADIQLRTNLSRYPPFCVAAAAIWSGRLGDLNLNRVYQLTDDDIQLIYDIVLETNMVQVAKRLGIKLDAAKARFRALRFRLGARTEAQAVDRAIQFYELPPPPVERITEAIDRVASEGFTATELEILKLRGKGLSRAQVANQVGLEVGPMDRLLVQLFRSLGVNSAAAAIAIVLWAGEPQASEPDAVDDEAYDELEIDMLVCMAKGLDRQDMADGLGLNIATCDSYRSRLFRKMSAANQPHAVGLATRDGLLDDWLETIDLDQVSADRFSPLYVKGLQLQASGLTIFHNLARLGLRTAHTWNNRVKADQSATALPLNMVIAILVRRGEITVEGRSVRPEDIASVQEVPVEAAEPAPAASTETSAAIETAGTGSTSTPRADDPIIQTLRSLIRRNRTDKEAMKGTAALSKKLAQYVERNFAIVVLAIQSGLVEAPWVHSRFHNRTLTDNQELFIAELINGTGLEEVRYQFDGVIKQADDPQMFRQWSIRYICTPLGARGPREAAVLTLWLKLTKIDQN